MQWVESAAALGLDEERLRAAADRLAGFVAAPDPPMPAGALVVGRWDKCLPAWRFGKLGPEPDAPPLPDGALFPLASITKPVVAIAVMQLVERGLVGLYDPVARHLARSAANGKGEVRVVHLLTHTSGLPENLLNNGRLRREMAPRERYHEEALASPLRFEPGTDVAYSNPGYLLLGLLVEAVAGRPLRDVLRDEVLAPLAMHNTMFGGEEGRMARVVTAGTGYESNVDWNSAYWRGLETPWGGLYSTPEDMARLASAFLAGSGRAVLSDATRERMVTNHLTDPFLPTLAEEARRRHRWGLGWKGNMPQGIAGPLVELLGPAVFGHQGMTGTTLWADPASGLFCAVLTTAPLIKAPWRILQVSNMVAAALRGAITHP